MTLFRQLCEFGFGVIDGPLPSERLVTAYDHAVATSPPAMRRVGSVNTRVHGLVNCAAFDELYVYRPLLDATSHLIGARFKLSSLLARTVPPGTQEQALHADVSRGDDAWPMLGFIVMVDAFRDDNGATRFLPRSSVSTVLACGRAGSMVIYDASIQHGHSANRSREPRRSIQGAFVRRDAKSWFEQSGEIDPVTLERISPFAKHVLGIALRPDA